MKELASPGRGCEKQAVLLAGLVGGRIQPTSCTWWVWEHNEGMGWLDGWTSDRTGAARHNEMRRLVWE
jgi:hypothetical protein